MESFAKKGVDGKEIDGITIMKQDLLKNVEKNKGWFMSHMNLETVDDWDVFTKKLKVEINNKEFFKVVD
ncbi:MAG: hypothetical protein GY787_07780 [Alteromonadales bacterium]|nr:hypothetical protein [Alteromonadales bacterium]